MDSRRRFLIAAAVVVISGVMSVLAAPELPGRMATHWNAAGQPDGTMSKPAALALVPAISTVLLVVFAVIPRIGPLRENIVSFRPVYDWFVVVFVVFMAVIHGGVIAFNLGYEFDFTLLVLAAVAGLFYYVESSSLTPNATGSSASGRRGRSRATKSEIEHITSVVAYSN